MSVDYALPEIVEPAKVKAKQVLLVANGDLRLAANQRCWPAQAEMEEALHQAVNDAGYELVRAHQFKPEQGHGFIGSQKEGMEVFAGIDRDAPLIVAEATWQYSHHLLHGLLSHKGPILTVANWSGTWPGLVGMLNLNGSLTKAGKKYSTLWGEDFSDPAFAKSARSLARQGKAEASDRARRRAGRGEDAQGAAPARRGAGRAVAAAEGHHGRIRRRLHGHVQRHTTGPSVESHRRL